MIPAALSVLRDYALIDITDDALIQPALPPEPSRLDGEDDERWAGRLTAYTTAAAKVATEWREAFDRATETGQWDALIVPGKTPTLFRIRQIGVTAWAAFKRAVRKMGEDEIRQLAFRLAVTGIDHLEIDVKLATAPYIGEDGRRERSFGDVLTADVVDAIGRAPGGAGVLARIGEAVMQGRGAPLGKS